MFQTCKGYNIYMISKIYKVYNITYCIYNVGMHIYVGICRYQYTHMPVHICIYMHIYEHMHTCINVYMPLHLCICIWISSIYAYAYSSGARVPACQGLNDLIDHA